jgi:hypothetical protein
MEINPLRARAIAGRVARTDAPGVHAARRVNRILEAVSSSQRAQFEAYSLLVNESDHPERERVADELTRTWIKERRTAEIWEHYAFQFGTDSVRGEWERQRDQIGRSIIRSARATLLRLTHRDDFPTSFDSTRHFTIDATFQPFGEEFGWLLINHDGREQIGHWIHEAGYRFPAGTFDPCLFNEQVFGQMMRRAPHDAAAIGTRKETLRNPGAAAALFGAAAPDALKWIGGWMKVKAPCPRDLRKGNLRLLYSALHDELTARERMAREPV